MGFRTAIFFKKVFRRELVFIFVLFVFFVVQLLLLKGESSWQ